MAPNTVYPTRFECSMFSAVQLSTETRGAEMHRDVVVLASPSPELLDRWERALTGFAPTLSVDQADPLRTAMLRQRPQIVLLDMDMPALSSPRAVGQLRSLNPASRIVVLGRPVSAEIELELFKAGIRGHCRSDIDPQLLKRVVLAVRLGELWIRRSLVSRLLEECGARFTGGPPEQRAAVGRLAFLTEREREIATLVGNGGTNKQIARQLDISERTVKAHLTEIFRKLGIGDRLKLALLLSGRHA